MRYTIQMTYIQLFQNHLIDGERYRERNTKKNVFFLPSSLYALYVRTWMPFWKTQVNCNLSGHHCLIHTHARLHINRESDMWSLFNDGNVKIIPFKIYNKKKQRKKILKLKFYFNTKPMKIKTKINQKKKIGVRHKYREKEKENKH